MAQRESEDNLLRLFFAQTCALHAALEGLGLFAAKTPESHLADPRQERGDEHLLGLLLAAPLGRPARLHRGMEAACHLDMDTPAQPPASRESISDTDRASSATGLKPSTTMARETVLTAWREWLK
jgi:hypothetical protein